MDASTIADITRRLWCPEVVVPGVQLAPDVSEPQSAVGPYPKLLATVLGEGSECC
ncbi:MAG: hypothetical protein M0T80_13930 [Actinomycetota bacterium]|nr:hypothetical protein [Actinomycetota bacterium]